MTSDAWTRRWADECKAVGARRTASSLAVAYLQRPPGKALGVRIAGATRRPTGAAPCL
jgi:hypothetical protein